MNTADLKSDLYNLIAQIDDINILKAIKVLLKKQIKGKKYSWDDFSEALKSEINQGLKDIENDDIITHKEAMQKYDQWLQK